MQIGLISDTHGLVRPGAVNAMREVSLIIHAGDIGSPEVLTELSAIGPVLAIRGNNNEGDGVAALPMALTHEIAGVRLHVGHAIADLVLDPVRAGIQVIVAGHSRRTQQRVRAGVHFINPGGGGPRRFKLPVSVAGVVRLSHAHPPLSSSRRGA